MIEEMAQIIADTVRGSSHRELPYIAAARAVIEVYNNRLMSDDCVQFSAHETFKRQQERCPSLLHKSPSTMRQECRDYIENAIQKAGE